jgi:hypothetical protein
MHMRCAIEGKRLLVAVIAAVLIGSSGMARAAFIWVEGEHATKAEVLRHPWYDQVKKGQLSGGEWVSNFDEPKAKSGLVEYKLAIPQAGEYEFWLRANPVQSSLKYQLNDGAWTAVDFASPIDSINIAADDKPDLRFVAWINLGKVQLKAGANALSFRMDSGNSNHGAIDCLTFVSPDMGFVPKGKARPGDPKPKTDVGPGRWAFEPDPDRYSDQALLDLSSLNEDQAGEHGFIKLSEDGRDLVRGDGQPIRFWCVNSYVFRNGPAALEDHARFLAKRGVNMVRWHGNIQTKDSANIQDIDANALDELWQNVAAMRKQGIYLTISPYYAAATKPVKGWPVPRRGGEDMHALLFFDDDLQAAYKQWLQKMLVPPNPYTGVALKDEPAVAILQMQNEDSLLFWTINNIKGKDALTLGRKFGQWAVQKHGSIDKALEAWGGPRIDGDNPAGGVLGMINVWEMTTQAPPPSAERDRRLADQLEFWTETMRAFNGEIARFLREDIGAQQIVNAGNWHAADPILLTDAERYSYTSTQVQGVNRYYTGGVHQGPNAGWAIVNGDKFSNESVLLNPRQLPLNLRQVAASPMIIPESHWVPPLGYQSEGPFLVSIMQSLSGVDGFYWFATGETQWRQPASANGFLPSEGKWVIATPEVMGNFPAAALMYRMGYIDPAPQPVVRENRAISELWSRRFPSVAEDPAFDPNRWKKQVLEHSDIPGGEVSPYAFLVGPVEVSFSDAGGPDQVMPDLGKFIDESAQIVRSATGQIIWDYGKGICTLNAPKAQGVSGFLKKLVTFELGDVTIQSSNDYATVIVVSMDDQPLAQSKKLLVQAGTIARPRGWKEKPARWKSEDGKQEMEGFEVVSFGQAPWAVIDNDMTITVKNSALTKASILDMNGMPRGTVELKREGELAKFMMPKDAKYVVVE